MTEAGRLVRRRQTLDDPEGYLIQRWMVLGAGGAVQFLAWEYLPGTETHSILHPIPGIREETSDGHYWQGIDLSTHGGIRRHPAEEQSTCDLLEGPCWLLSSSLDGIVLMERIITDGQMNEDLIWAQLETEYRTYLV